MHKFGTGLWNETNPQTRKLHCIGRVANIHPIVAQFLPEIFLPSFGWKASINNEYLISSQPFILTFNSFHLRSGIPFNIANGIKFVVEAVKDFLKKITTSNTRTNKINVFQFRNYINTNPVGIVTSGIIPRVAETLRCQNGFFEKPLGSSASLILTNDQYASLGIH